MSSIDEVVARSRIGGEFSQRKTFTLARNRAIQKMRKFALADPYFYVLEFIQAAIGNGATWVTIEANSEGFTLSYVGGHFREDQLGQIFDFLFAGKDRADIGHVRELALGLNALMLFDPERVTVESGDGTHAGSTRMVVRQGAEMVEIGRPVKPLRGTYIRAENLKRSRVSGAGSERRVIEERCLTAPIPLIVNGMPVFGFSSRRVPRLLGFGRVIEFDEGDLFGALGMGAEDFTPNFKLLTFGVWIQSGVYPLLSEKKEVGGVICFDQLHKTADHSGVVHDQVWEEMWMRLRPYAHRLAAGETGSITGNVRLLDGTVLTVRELRPVLRGAKRVLVVPPEVKPGTDKGQVAAEIGKALNAPVIRAPRPHLSWVQALAGPDVPVLQPDLVPADRAFYLQPEAEPPDRPWLASPVTVEPVDMKDLTDHMACLFLTSGKAPEGADRPGLARAFRERLGELGEVRATVYTPALPRARGPANRGASPSGQISGPQLDVQLSTVDRLLWEGSVHSAFPGHVLRILLPDIPPGRLTERLTSQPGDFALHHYVTAVMTRKAEQALREASEHALKRTAAADEETEVVAVTASRIALAALGRSLVTRFRADSEGNPRVDFSTLSGSVSEGILDRPLFATLAGEQVSMRELAGMMDRTFGLVYGVVPVVEPDLKGLDTGPILKLSLEREWMLLSLLGESAYVRVDQRDVLAEYEGVKCRDVALGLVSYPDFPLLTEGADPSGFSDERRSRCLRGLLDQLVRCYVGTHPPRPKRPEEQWTWEENRRQALRHLLWFVCRSGTGENTQAESAGLWDLPLFLDSVGECHTFRQVVRATRTDEGLLLHLRPTFAGPELGLLALASLEQGDKSAGGANVEPSEPVPTELSVSPFTARLLKRLGGVHLALDFDLPHETAADAERAAERDYLQRAEINGEGFSGVVGIPARPSSDPRVYVLEPQTGRVYANRDVARRFGLVGLVRLGRILDGELDGSVVSALWKAGETLMKRAVEDIPGLDPGSDRYNQTARMLLEFGFEHVSLTGEPDGTVIPSVFNPLAGLILDLPLFPTEAGFSVSGMRLTDQYCAFGRLFFADDAEPRTERSGPSLTIMSEPAFLKETALKYLNEGRVARPASSGTTEEAGPQNGPPPALQGIPEVLKHWLQRLRPDEPLDARGEKRPPVEVVMGGEWQFASEGETECFRYNAFRRAPTLTVNEDHWLARWAAAHMRSEPEALAALLLAAYAYINELEGPVTNVHERIFQMRVLQALQRGELET